MTFYTKVRPVSQKQFKKLNSEHDHFIPCRLKLSGRKKKITYRINRNHTITKEYFLYYIKNNLCYIEQFSTKNQKGEYHSINDNPSFKNHNSKEWHIHGQIVRENNKPSVIHQNTIYYTCVINNIAEYHRIGGPAIIQKKLKIESWYYKGTKIPFKTNLKLIKSPK